MKPLRLLRAALLLLTPLSLHAAVSAAWTTPIAPFQIADNVYYVGSQDLAAYLITTPSGNILINANLDSSPALIRASVQQLGFQWADTRILLNGQAHFDHMAGAAQILRETHARNMVMDSDAPVVESGGRSDFAYNTDGLYTFPPAHVDRVLHNLDTVQLGGVTLTAHRTAGHTHGCTTWTLRAHMAGDPASTLRNIVIVGGFAPLQQYRLVDRPGQPASYPGIATDFQHTYATLRALPCDVFLGAHGVYFNMLDKLSRLKTQGPSVWIDPTGYRTAIDQAQTNFITTLQSQQTPKKL